MAQTIEVRPVRTEADYDAALAAVRPFFDSPPEPGSLDADRFELLIQVIKAWEDEHCPVPDASAAEVIKLSMEANGRSLADLAAILGDASHATEFLEGRLGLSIEQVRRLHAEWRIPADALSNGADEAQEQRIVRFPTEEEAQAAFRAYAEALGRATYAWNYLLGRLSRLFVVVVDADRERLLGVWYAPDNDRSKVQMLRAAITKSKADRWLPRLPNARADLDWLCVEAEKIIDDRNNAVHSPTILGSSPDGHEMVANPFVPYRRAAALAGKKLIKEFKWLEDWADELSRFAILLEGALHPDDTDPWPSRPQKPSRK